MKNDKNIAILMATYNGAQYLREQMDSLINQTNQDWSLFVYDDGSTDETLNIIQEYTERYGWIKVLPNNPQKKRGAKYSFVWLLEQVDSPYYLFCDQDDIWLPHKIDLLANRMFEEEKKTPCTALCVHSDSAITDENGFVKEASLWRHMTRASDLFDSLKMCQVTCRVFSHNLLINQKAKESVFPFDDRIYMHDWWIALKVNAIGGRVIGVHSSTTLYRQHSHNVCAAPSFGSNHYWVSKLRNLGQTYRNGLVMYQLMHDTTGCSRLAFYTAKFYLVFYQLCHYHKS